MALLTLRIQKVKFMRELRGATQSDKRETTIHHNRQIEMLHILTYTGMDTLMSAPSRMTSSPFKYLSPSCTPKCHTGHPRVVGN